MKKTTLVATLALCVNALFISQVQATPVTELDSIVAVVDDDVVTRRQLDQRVDTIKQQISLKSAQMPNEELLQRQVLERLIIETLQMREAERLGIRVSEESLDRIVANIAKENQLTLTQLREVLLKDGVTFTQFRDNLRRELLINQLKQREVDNKVSVSEHEINAYLERTASLAARDEEYHLRHILIAVPDGSSPERIDEARGKAEQIRSELLNGADFASTAINHSDSRQALEGGDLGWRKAGELPSLFSEVVPNMQAGEISELLRNTSGFHILLLEEKRGGERHMVQQTHARHILIRTNEIASETEVLNALERVRERLKNSEDFAKLARAISEDPGSAAKGGDLGWASPGQFVPEFEQTMNSLAIGEISKPFKSQFGWHIMQVLERRNYDSTDEVNRSKALEALKKRKVSEDETQWLRSLRDNAYVEIRLGE